MMFMRATRATTVSRVAVIAHRPMAASPYPTTMALRCGTAMKSRRVNPYSKSAAIPKPVKTPVKAADWRRTKTNWNAV